MARSMDARTTDRLLPRVATIALVVCGVLAAVLMLFQVSNTPSPSPQEIQVVAVANADVVKPPSRSVKEEASIKIKIKAAAASACELQDCKVVPGDVNICGSDGKVYYNECLFQNAQCHNGNAFSKVTDWNGYHCPTTCKEHIVCKEIGKFLCGSDGNVYFGYCRLYEAQCVDKALQEIACPQGLIQFPPRSHRP